MKANSHSKSVQEEKLGKIVKGLEDLREEVSTYVTPLTPKERKVLPKMGEKTLAFVEKCFEFSKSNPELCPGFFDKEAFEVDFKDARGLYGAVNMATQLKENLADTQMSAGSEAFQTALLFYNSAKMATANNVAGAKAVYEELRKRFPYRRRRKPAEEKAPAQAEEATS
jgi:hypothetical protein